jgi:hypothetical protein
MDIMTIYAEIYNQKITEPFFRIYFDTLKEQKVDDLITAFKDHAKVGAFFPKPSEIIKIIKTNKSKPIYYKALPHPEISNEKLDAILHPLYEQIKKRTASINYDYNL